MSPTKEINGVSMCKKGQEYVQELFQKMHDIFKYMTTKANQVFRVTEFWPSFIIFPWFLIPFSCITLF